jgi:hypothetical protein
MPGISSVVPNISPTASYNPCIKDNFVYCALNPNVRGNTIDDMDGNLRITVCKPGWTSTIRPPVSWTDGLKLQLLRQRGLDSENAKDYELDHRMPLELGGAPGSADVGLLWENVNLSLESPASPNPKDSDESKLHREVCAKRLTLIQAQQELVDTWLLPGDKYKK